jgi:hypothetical protein
VTLNLAAAKFIVLVSGVIPMIALMFLLYSKLQSGHHLIFSKENGQESERSR